MPPPARPPLGLTLNRTAKAVGRAFDDALAAAGGSLPIWLILISLKTSPQSNQRQLAEAVGVQGATLTHHLDAMETDGLLTRRRDPANRRTHIVELTDKGESAFHRLRAAAGNFDRQLRRRLTEEDVRELERLLAQLHDNAAGDA